MKVPYNQNYWQALHLAIYSKNAIGGILHWQFWVLYGKKFMVAVYMAYIKIGNHYTIRQTAKLKWPPNILVVRYIVMCYSYEWSQDLLYYNGLITLGINQINQKLSQAIASHFLQITIATSIQTLL